MHALTISWPSSDVETVAQEIQRLFDLHDRRLKPETKASLTLELSKSGLPVSSVLAGIQRLTTESLKQITLPMLLDAAREGLESDPHVHGGPCANCQKSGRVLMHDENRRIFALACDCSWGNALANQGFTRWEGNDTQYSRSRVLTRA